METGDKPFITLDYAKPRSIRESRIIKWLTSLPHWWIALVLLVPVWMFDHFGLQRVVGWQSERAAEHLFTFLYFAVLFIPGALRRLDGRHVLVVLGLAGAWYGVDAAFSRCPLNLPFPYSLVFWAAMPVVIVGVSEWLLVCPRSRRSLLWVMILSVAVGCLIPLIQKPLDCTGVSVSIPGVGGWHRRTTWGGIIYWPLLVILTWAAVPAGLKLGQQADRYNRFIAAGLAMASAAAFVLFFHIVMYQMAHRSLVGDGPFDRSWSASILETRGNQSDLQAMWEALEKADWSKLEDYGSWDYRKACIGVLARRDRQAAAQRLSEMLRGKPSGVLAGFCAQLLGEERRYEAAPFLMRNALLGNSQCTEALEAMRVPSASLAVIRDISVHSRPAPLTADFPISPQHRERLIRLLGKDVGPNLSDWTSYYDSVVNQLPTPLPHEVASETSRVIQAMMSYWDAADRLYKAKCRLLVRRLEQDGRSKYVEQMTAFEPLLSQQPLTDENAAGIAPAMLQVIESYKQKAFSDMAVPPPNWNVRNTAALEQEVANYANGVDAMAAKHGVAATTPSTSPSSSGISGAD